MTAWCCTARIYLASLRPLTVRKSLACLRWGKPGTFPSDEKFSWFKTQLLVKTTLACWGITELSLGVRCQEAPNKCTQIKGAVLPKPVGEKPGGFVWHLGFSLHLGLRACVLLLKFGPLILLYPWTYLCSGFTSLWLQLLLKATESSGPTFIKLGQWASTRRDLFSEEFCTKFSKLHVKASPHPWGHTKQALQRAFGENWKKVLKFKSKEPIGSGCVAQVYKAYADATAIEDPQFEELVRSTESDSALEAWEVSGFQGIFRWCWKKHGEMFGESNAEQLLQKDSSHGDTSRTATSKKSVTGSQLTTNTLPPVDSSKELGHFIPVAIKVLHPGLVHQVQMDLFLMKMGSQIIELLPGVKWLSLTEIVEEFEKLMIYQTDLRYEARNLERFQQNFLGMDFVKFPTPLHPFVTRNILMETFEVFVDNFVHADLHPGNILVQGAKHFGATRRDQTTIVDMCDTLIVEVQPSLCQLRLVLLDAGVVAELQEADLQNFRAVFTAVAQGQGERVGELILHHARANQCKDIERFKAEMAELVTKARMNTVALGKLQVANLLSSVFKLLMIHKVKLESNFASVVFAIMVLEGLGRSLDPKLDILEEAKPLLIKTAAALLK
uniref:AarF domain containing kinase 2 n=1 Tax=Crocodylus porosus TaxID=8502 RepID=A0A7M4FJF9_CROPO